MVDLAILFFHHRCDEEATRYHFAMLKSSNDGVPVVPVVRKETLCLAGSSDVYVEDEFASEDNWRAADVAFLQWFRQRPFDAERYIWMEWDCLCNVSLKEWYGEVWDADCAGSRLENIGPEYWFREDVLRLPPEMAKVAAAISPFNGIMISHRALTAIASKPYPQNVFCEVRMPSAVRAAGFELETFPPAKEATNRFRPDQIVVEDKPCMFHPVKTVRRIGAILPSQMR